MRNLSLASHAWPRRPERVSLHGMTSVHQIGTFAPSVCVDPVPTLNAIPSEERPKMIESHDYTLTLRGTGPKTGTLTDQTLEVALDVASPPEFGGPGGVWSPEHLFLASLSACLMTTFRAIADGSGVEVLGYSDNAVGHLQRGDDRLYRMDRVTLRPRIMVSRAQADRALRLIQKAEAACLISRSVNSEIVMEPDIQVVEPVG